MSIRRINAREGKKGRRQAAPHRSKQKRSYFLDKILPIILAAVMNSGGQIVSYVTKFFEPTPITLASLEALRERTTTQDSVSVTVHRAGTN